MTDPPASSSTTARRRKRRRNKTPINLDGIRSVARPEQVMAHSSSPTALVTGGQQQELLMTDDLLFALDAVEQDPVVSDILQRQKSVEEPSAEQDEHQDEEEPPLKRAALSDTSDKPTPVTRLVTASDNHGEEMAEGNRSNHDHDILTSPMVSSNHKKRATITEQNSQPTMAATITSLAVAAVDNSTTEIQGSSSTVTEESNTCNGSGGTTIPTQEQQLNNNSNGSDSTTPFEPPRHSSPQKRKLTTEENAQEPDDNKITEQQPQNSAENATNEIAGGTHSSPSGSVVATVDETNNAADETVWLPVSYIPPPNAVMICKWNNDHHHPGNLELQRLVQTHLAEYQAVLGNDIRHKTLIIERRILAPLAQFQNATTNMPCFVRFDTTHQRWHRLSLAEQKKYTARAFRSMAAKKETPSKTPPQRRQNEHDAHKEIEHDDGDDDAQLLPVSYIPPPKAVIVMPGIVDANKNDPGNQELQRLVQVHLQDYLEATDDNNNKVTVIQRYVLQLVAKFQNATTTPCFVKFVNQRWYLLSLDEQKKYITHAFHQIAKEKKSTTRQSSDAKETRNNNNNNDDEEEHTDHDDAQLLPENYSPPPNAVILGRSNPPGNQHFLSLVQRHVQEYRTATEWGQKTSVVHQRVLTPLVKFQQTTTTTRTNSSCMMMKKHDAGALFVKWDANKNRWYRLSLEAQIKYSGRAFRDAAGDYKSSKKRILPQQQQQQPDGEEPPPPESLSKEHDNTATTTSADDSVPAAANDSTSTQQQQLQQQEAEDVGVFLPADYRPAKDDVIVGDGGTGFESNPGNQQLRELVQCAYSAGQDPPADSVLESIMKEQKKSMFVQNRDDDKGWYRLGKAERKSYIVKEFHAVRSLLQTKKKKKKQPSSSRHQQSSNASVSIAGSNMTTTTTTTGQVKRLARKSTAGKAPRKMPFSSAAAAAAANQEQATVTTNHNHDKHKNNAKGVDPSSQSAPPKLAAASATGSDNGVAPVASVTSKTPATRKMAPPPPPPPPARKTSEVAHGRSDNSVASASSGTATTNGKNHTTGPAVAPPPPPPPKRKDSRQMSTTRSDNSVASSSSSAAAGKRGTAAPPPPPPPNRKTSRQVSTTAAAARSDSSVVSSASKKAPPPPPPKKASSRTISEADGSNASVASASKNCSAAPPPPPPPPPPTRKTPAAAATASRSSDRSVASVSSAASKNSKSTHAASSTAVAGSTKKAPPQKPGSSRSDDIVVSASPASSTGPPKPPLSTTKETVYSSLARKITNGSQPPPSTNDRAAPFGSQLTTTSPATNNQTNSVVADASSLSNATTATPMNRKTNDSPNATSTLSAGSHETTMTSTHVSIDSTDVNDASASVQEHPDDETATARGEPPNDYNSISNCGNEDASGGNNEDEEDGEIKEMTNAAAAVQGERESSVIGNFYKTLFPQTESEEASDDEDFSEEQFLASVHRTIQQCEDDAWANSATERTRENQAERSFLQDCILASFDEPAEVRGGGASEETGEPAHQLGSELPPDEDTSMAAPPPEGKEMATCASEATHASSSEHMQSETSHLRAEVSSQSHGEDEPDQLQAEASSQTQGEDEGGLQEDFPSPDDDDDHGVALPETQGKASPQAGQPHPQQSRERGTFPGEDEPAPQIGTTPSVPAAHGAVRDTGKRKHSNLPAWMTRQQSKTTNSSAQASQQPSGQQEDAAAQSLRRETMQPRRELPPRAARRGQQQATKLGNTADEPICLDSDSEDDDVPGVQPGREQRAQHQSQGDETSPKKLVSLVHVKRTIPKYYISRQTGQGSALEKQPLLTRDTLVTQIEMPFRDGHMQHFKDRGNGDHHFSVELQDIEGHPDAWLLFIRGRKILVETFRLHFEQWLHNALKRRVFLELLRDNNRAEIDVVLPRQPLLDAWRKGCIQAISMNNRTGLWIDFSEHRKGDDAIRLLTPILGSPMLQSDIVVAILRIDGVEYSSIEAWEEVRKRFQGLEQADTRVTLVIRSSVSLDALKPNDETILDVRRNNEGTLPPTEIQVEEKSGNDISSLNQSVSRSARRESQSNSPEDRAHLNGHWHANLQFKKKYKEIYDIEYQRSEVHYQFAMKEMWAQHKQYYAYSCGDDCECAFDLELLTQNVVARFIREYPDKMTGSDLTHDHDSPVGFVDRFAGKFVPLLRDEYPEEKPSRILERLVRMWTLHLRQRGFGSTCYETCTCEEGWGPVFFKGNVLRELPVAASRRKRAAVPVESLPSVPRKRSRPETATPRVAAAQRSHFQSTQTNEQSSSLLRGQHQPHGVARDAWSVNTRRQSNLSDAASTTVEHFSESFTAGIPLGFYCVTERAMKSRVCAILSVDPLGACAKKNANIRKGTLVEKIRIMQGTELKEYAIHGHEDMRRYKTLAMELRSDLVICFCSAKLPPASSHDDPDAVGADWTVTGQWQGKSVGGWAGGSNRRVSTQQGNSLPRRTLPSQRSILHSGSRKTGSSSKHVNFADNCGLRRFSANERVFRLEPETKEGTKFETTIPESNAHTGTQILDAISKAVGNRACANLIRYLQSAKTVVAGKDFRFFLSQQLDMAKKNEAGDRISNILKAFKSAHETIAIAQRLKCFQRLRVEVEKIVDFRLTAKGEKKIAEKSCKSYLFHMVDDKSKKLTPSPPPMDMVSGEIDYGSGNSAVPEYTLDYNPGERHLLHVELHSTKGTMDARLSIPLNEVVRDHLKTDPAATIVREFRVGHDGLLEGGVKMQLRVELLKDKLTDRELSKKIAVKADKFQNMLDQMKTINAIKKEEEPAIHARIYGEHGFSLLHAAVAFGKKDLVQQILKLDANPMAPSSMGTAIVYSGRKRLAATEKVKKVKLSRCKTADLVRFDFHLELAKSQNKRELHLEEQAVEMKTIAYMIRKHANPFADKEGPGGLHDGPGSGGPNDGPGSGGANGGPRPDGSDKRPRERDDVSDHKHVSWHDWDADPGDSSQVEAAANQQSAVSFEANRVSPQVYSLLQYLGQQAKPGDKWVELDAIKTHCGAEEWSEFDNACASATSKGLIQWGYLDETIFGADVESLSHRTSDDGEEGNHLRLTDAGEGCLASTPTPADNQNGAHHSASNANNTSQRGHGQVSTSTYAFLQSLTPTTPDDDWVGMSAVEEAFYVNLGQRDVSVFRRVREEATNMGLIEWGQIDTETFGDSEVELASPSDFDSTASNALLRLTNLGGEMLSRGPPANDHAESTHVESQGAGRSRSQESQSGVRSTISTSAYVFLQSLTPTSPDDDWVGMSAVEEVFYVNLGQRDVSVFRRVREETTNMGFIEWGHIDTETFGDSEVELASPVTLIALRAMHCCGLQIWAVKCS
ncbi:expressed unknown protein [Seminavis robusta]|uniref:Uncharacterized protein n=1 Tax=Seminavis robusta TaxID=568900 RepID=A0A9N8EVK8_9STRA|nr:expressed unknown protein [Seminavis robusta]|eukprot:Sro1893_g303890.1 n/a (3315) ;mRNA; r:4379-14968